MLIKLILFESIIYVYNSHIIFLYRISTHIISLVYVESNVKSYYSHLETELPDLFEKKGNQNASSLSKSNTNPRNEYPNLIVEGLDKEELSNKFQFLLGPYLVELNSNNIDFNYSFSSSTNSIYRETDYYPLYRNKIFDTLNFIIESLGLDCHYKDINNGRYSADFALLEGYFIDPESEPDLKRKRSRNDNRTYRTLALVEMEMSWKLIPVEDELDLVDRYKRDREDVNSTIYNCIQQMITNMHASKTRYGVITTHKHTYIVRLSVTKDGPALAVSNEFDRGVNVFQVYFYLALLLRYFYILNCSLC